MSKRIVAEKPLTQNSLKFRMGKRLLHSRRSLQLGGALLRRNVSTRHNQLKLDFALQLAEQLYTAPSRPIVWCNLFVPSELIWGLGLVPFYPETAAAVGAGLGLSAQGLEEAQTLGYPVDLCTFHRSAAGLRTAGLYPRADVYIATSNLCDVTGQVLANFAYTDGSPFFFLDIPQTEDEAAVAYVTTQLRELVDCLTTELGFPLKPEQMRQAVRSSNEARALALEVTAMREADPAPLRGSAMLDQLGLLTSMFGHPTGVAYYRALRDYTLERIRRADPEQANQKVRLYWMHLGPYFPSELCPHLEDDLGAVIAFEEASTVWWDALDEEQPLPSLARKMLAMYFNGSMERRLNLALHHIARYRCAGAVHFSHWGCRQSSGALRVIRDRLRREGVPLLTLEGDCVDPTNLSLGPLHTRVEAFLETLT